MYKINTLKALDITLKPVLEWVNSILTVNKSQHPKWPFLATPLETRAKLVGKLEQIHMADSVIIQKLKSFRPIIRFVMINLSLQKIMYVEKWEHEKGRW